MRLQLITIIFLFFTYQIGAQEVIENIQPKPQPVDVNFLFSYYDQDGDHSAVTGGKGTEKLEDYASKIIINVLLDSLSDLSVHTHINYYSSASTDNINDNVSSASSADIRAQIDVSYTKKNLKKNTSYGFNLGGSVESDYISFFTGGIWSKESDDGNREFSIDSKVYFDTWRLIFPDELRETAHQDVNTDKRRTVFFSFTYSQIFTKRLVASITSELIFQNGLLSTPFHRVYFVNDGLSIEKLPPTRYRIPLGLRLNYFFGDRVITRFYYRSYGDNFGIFGNTLSLTIPVKIIDVLWIEPLYRFHTQTASNYFKPFGNHDPAAKFYTSDYDLSHFYSHKAGFGIRFVPSDRLEKLKKESKRFQFKSLSLRCANYWRSDGMRAFIVSFHSSMDF